MNAPTRPRGNAGAVRAWLLGWRNRLLANPRFQRWAAGFPLTRHIARREAAGLFDLCAGFVYSQILFACVRLQLLDLLAEGTRDKAEIERHTGLAPDAAERLLEAAASLALVDRLGDGRYMLGSRGAALLANPGIAAMIEHHALLYQDLADPVALLRHPNAPTLIARYWAYARNPDARGLAPHDVAAYSSLMTLSQPLIASQVLEAYSFARHRCVLDVGGGEGAFLLALAPRAPALRLMLFDLPGVATRARARVADAGCGERVHVLSGDFFQDPLPIGADLVTLLRVVHDHDDAEALRLLRAVRRCLPDDGMVLLAEPMSDAPGAERVGAAYFGFYLLAMRSGRARPPERLCALLCEAGFERPRVIYPRLPLQAVMVTAHVSK